MLLIHHLVFAIFITTGVMAATVSKKLTLAGAVTGGLVGTAIYAGAGWLGIALLSIFFVIGTACTSYKKGIKQGLGLAQESGSRTASQVLANGGVAALVSLLVFLLPQHNALLLLMIAGSLSSATADTVSSELGSVHGKKFYDILSFKRGMRGRDGVISVEGLLLGMIGSAVIALVYAFGTNDSYRFMAIIIAGTAGNLADSYLGATLERRCLIGNDVVNFLNTAIGALVALLLS